MPKIDMHCHILDPQQFPYSKDAAYHPSGQEIGTAHYFDHVLSAFNVEHALLVGPNSGYETDNRCMLHAIRSYPERFKGIAVVNNNTPQVELQTLKEQGVIGIAFNASLKGVEHYQNIEPLLKLLCALDMWAQFQVEGDQLTHFLPMIEKTGVKVLLDHCARPYLEDGTQSPGIQALKSLAQSGQTVVKISGFSKFSKLPFPFPDTQAHVEFLVHTFGLDHCIWASDWPYLKATARLDYGALLKLEEQRFSKEELHQLMWATPKRVLGL
jgi:predicted TIM-barrel fold metal-dependent hydrolase